MLASDSFKIGVLLWLFFTGALVNAQDFGRAGSQAQLANLSDSAKIKFINKNFYNLYSADFNNSNELCEWAAKTASENGWTLDEAYANLNWGVITYLSGDYENVLPKYFKALTLFEQLDYEMGVAAVNNEMAVFYSKQGDPESSYKCLDLSEKLAREINDQEKLGTSLGIRAAILSKYKRHEEAEPYFKEVYKIRLNTKDSIGLGYVLLDLAEMAQRNGSLKTALTYINQSTVIREKIGDKQGVAVNMITMGEVFITDKKYKEAIPWLEDGIKMAESMGYIDLRREGIDALANAYVGLNEFRDAYTQRAKWYALSDSLLNIDKAKVINELRAKYETEKKEFQLAEQQLTLEKNNWIIASLLFTIVLLVIIIVFWRRHVDIRKKQEKLLIEQEYQKQLIESTITSQENERARFAKDLHDDLGQLISSAKLFVSQSSDSWAKSASNLLDQMHLEIRNIAFALLPNTLVNEGLVSALRELANRLNESKKVMIKVSETGMKARLSETMEISLYRVCQEWLNNILKHGNAKSIFIQFTHHGDQLSMVVEDDGNGFDPMLLEHSKGNGWKNMQSRIQLHGGTVFIESSNGKKGSSLIVDIPLEPNATMQVA